MSRQIAQPLGHYELATDEALALISESLLRGRELETIRFIAKYLTFIAMPKLFGF
jgi:hypothetical protein